MKIAVFYHLYQAGKWGQILGKQASLMRSSGLLDAADFVSVGVNGEIVMEDSDKFVFYTNTEQHKEETPTLKRLMRFAKDNPEYKILYLHSKGANKSSKEIDDWRNLLNYFAIDKWKESVKLLEQYDAVGCNYSEDTWLGHYPHFSGNFWWANAEYINKLDYKFLESESRWDREFWIGSGNGKLYSMHDSGIDHYRYAYPKEMYER